MEKYIIIGLLAWLYIFGVVYVKQLFEDEEKRIDPKAKTAKWMLISAMLWPILLILSPFIILFHETMNNTIFWLWWGVCSIVAEKMNN